jgi:hypothetical protein
MSDELIATTLPNNWPEVVGKCKELFSLIGNSEFRHDVISPQECIGHLAQTLQNEHFSTIIDLTDNGWLSASLHDLFPATPVIKALHISRVREVSNPELPTSGHIVNLNPKQIDDIKKESDLSRPLIIDDVSFSGSSSELTMNLFGLNPKETSNAFLITNIGELGLNQGAKTKLEGLGSKVFTGQILNTSENEDGWHIKDFVQHPTLERSLGLIVTIHEIIQKDGKDSELLKRLFLTEALRGILFPFALSFEKIESLQKEGRFRLPGGKLMESLAEGMHTTNPTLLTSPYFLGHISSESFRDNLDRVSEIIHEIQFMTKDKEVQLESTIGLRREVEKGLFRGGAERKI